METQGILTPNSQLNVAIKTTNTDFTTTLHYEQGNMGETVHFFLSCNHLPIGSRVSFASDAAGPNPPIFIPEVVVTTSPSFTVGIISNVPAGYSANLTIRAWFPQAPSRDASIRLSAQGAVH